MPWAVAHTPNGRCPIRKDVKACKRDHDDGQLVGGQLFDFSVSVKNASNQLIGTSIVPGRQKQGA